MNDLCIDRVNNALIIENGDFKLISGLEQIKQEILVAFYTLKGDWLLNYEKGIDYPRGMRNNAFLIHDIKNQILGVSGVKSIEKFDFKKTGVNITINIAIETEFGQVELSEVMSK